MLSSAIRVAVRPRPLLENEIPPSVDALKFVDVASIEVQQKRFDFDYVFPPSEKNETVYSKAVADKICHIFEGSNLTILAYGPTGSGKTYTMGTGCTRDSDSGIISRGVEDIFRYLQSQQVSQVFVVKVTFLELYQNDIYDLLQDSARCEITENRDGVRVKNLLEVEVKTAAEAFAALEKGLKGRRAGSTAKNISSSHSHAIFSVHVEQTDKVTFLSKRSKFQLVDLAGSERICSSKTEGKQLTEGIDINLGLFTLGKVILALKNRASHIPFRDSVLTRLLRDSLGGNSHTVMIVCMNPSATSIEETLNTLRYASSARSIRNRPEINKESATVTIMKLKKELQKYRDYYLCGIQSATHDSSTPSDPLETSETQTDSNINSDFLLQLQRANDKIEKLEQKYSESEELCDELLKELMEINGEVKLLVAEMTVEAATNSNLLAICAKLEDISKKCADCVVNSVNAIMASSNEAWAASVETVCNKQLNRPENRAEMKDQSTFPALPVHLSVIMETSRECYTSSSSSGSSASVTKLSQLDQCYSHERSNINRHLTKDYTFKEPRRHYQLPSVSLVQGKKNALPRDITENANSNTVKTFCSDEDPFDESLNVKLLKSLNTSPDFSGQMQILEKSIRGLKIKDTIQIMDASYVIESLIAEGSFGKVYKATIKTSDQSCKTKHLGCNLALKITKDASDWEFYICSTLHQRLKHLNSYPDIHLSVMQIVSAQKYRDALVLAHEFSQQGTLVDLVNTYNKQNTSIPQYITMYLTLEMLHVVSKIHECKIIHGDIKPDNILLQDNLSKIGVMNISTQKTAVLKVIDFGRAIDLNFFEPGICFKSKLKDGCIEMKKDKPWVFQLDWYGLLNCVHVLLFSDYMKVRENSNGRWEIVKNFKRYWEKTIWVPLFDELLNIPACYQEPDIESHTRRIEAKLKEISPSF